MSQDIIWTNPATGETFVVDQQTGNSYSQNQDISTESEEMQGRRTLGAQARSTTDKVPEWIRVALEVRYLHRNVRYATHI